ncbi:MAG: WG repeat-containing protein [Helicobacteraceae bacterium]|jgi:hypothetical protein|nr:WG repeat-containing protein [Helicobacteraceae bacterium]
MKRILVFLGACAMFCAANQTLSPFYVEGYGWGYIDEKGDFAIEPRFKKAYKFSEGLAIVETANEKEGAIDIKGEFVIKPTFYSIGYFNENGLASASKKSGEKSGLIDKTGSFKVKPKFDAIYRFSKKWGRFLGENDLALVEVDKKYGFINVKGEYIVNPEYDRLLSDDNGSVVFAIKDRKFGRLDSEGKFVLDEKLEDFYIGAFNSKDIAPIRKKGERIGFINEQGDIVIEPQFTSVDRFAKSGLAKAANEAAVKGKYKWGVIDMTGRFIVPPKYDDISIEDNLIEIVTEVREEKKPARFIRDYYDQTGKLVVGGIDTHVISDGDMYIFSFNRKYGMLSKKEGRIVLEPIYDEVKYFKLIGLAQVRVTMVEDEKPFYVYGIANAKGEFILEPKYKDNGSYRGKFKVGNAAIHMNEVGMDIEGDYDKNADFVQKINKAIEDYKARERKEQGSYSDVAQVREVCGVIVAQNKQGEITFPKKYIGKVSDTPESVVKSFYSGFSRGFDGHTVRSVTGANFKFPATKLIYKSQFYKEASGEFRKIYANFLWQLSIQRQAGKPKIDNVQYCNDDTLAEVTALYEDKDGEISMAKSSFGLIKTGSGWKIFIGE